MLFYECSAKTGINIQKIFNQSVEIVLAKVKANEFDLTDEFCGIKQIQ